MNCPLCGSNSTTSILTDKHRKYVRCAVCDLVSVPVQFHLTPQQEKVEYDLHENDVHDAGYRKFLNRLFEPLQQFLTPGMCGLDFGCGPGPLLSQMLRDAGYPTSIYDPFYAPNRDVLAQHYDFVTCSEVVEHFSQPAVAWQELTSLLKPGGYLAVMTWLHNSATIWSTWNYKNDRTHVSFYSLQTMQWICEKLCLQILHHDDRVVVFKRDQCLPKPFSKSTF